jgi:hypothetical protein
LQLLLAKELGVFGLRVVDAALGLGLPLPASRPLVFSLCYGLCRVPIAHTLVTSLQKIIIWNVVGIDILLNLLERPIGERVHLDDASVVNFNDVEIATLAPLTPPPSSEYSLDWQFGVGAVQWLDFHNIVIEILVLFPQFFTMLSSELLDSVAASRLVDVDGGSVSPSDSFHKGQGLIEVVESIQEDQIHIGLDRSGEL